MISEKICDEISQRFGSSPLPYVVHVGLLWERVETDGVFWELPPLTEDEKPVDIRYQELLRKASKLAQVDIHDPTLKSIETQIKQLLPDVKLEQLYGLEIFTRADLRVLDKYKGIRKEWFEIREKYKGFDVSFFMDYKMVSREGKEGIDYLVAMPSGDQYDFLCISRTRTYIGKNATEILIRKLEILDQEYGLTVLFATEITLDFLLEKPIERENFYKIRSRILRICPDAEQLSSKLHLGVVYLWWD